MIELLSDNEVQYLKEHFRLGKIEQDSDLSIQISKLLNQDTLRVYIGKIKNKINASNTGVAASMFIKRYSYLAALSLYSMSVFNKGINVSIENVILESEDQDGWWLPRIRFNTLQVIAAPLENRDEWRDKVLQNLFAENIDILLTALSKENKISKYILWENVATYIFWLYETILHKEIKENKRIKEDAEYLILQAKGNLFGNYRSNPLSRYFHSKQFIPNVGEVRVRSTCCLAYLSEKGYRCNNCPFECNIPNSH